MRSYKWFRWLLRASALTTVMFVMQACYGAPYRDKDMPNPMEMSDEAIAPETPAPETPVADTLVQAEI